MDLPIVGSSLQGLLNFQQRIDAAIARIDAQHLDTIQSIQRFLDTQLGAGSVGIIATDPHSLQLRVNLAQTLLNVPLDAVFSSVVDVATNQIGVQARGKTNVSGEASSTITVGLNYGPGDALERFYVDTKQQASRASISGLTIQSPLTQPVVQLGLNNVSVNRIETTLSNGRLDAWMQSPGIAEKITLSEFGQNNLDWVTSDSSGNDVKWNIILANVGSTTPKIEANWSSWKHSGFQTPLGSSGLQSLITSASTFSDSSARQGLFALMNLIGGWTNRESVQSPIAGLENRWLNFFQTCKHYSHDSARSRKGR